jgi:hypothetical protein
MRARGASGERIVWYIAEFASEEQVAEGTAASTRVVWRISFLAVELPHAMC